MHLSWYSKPVGFATSASTPPPALADERLMRPWESTGSFWIPGIPQQQCWGTVSFKPGSGIEVTLEGNLFGGRIPPRPFEIPVIHGRLFNGALCSIFSCWCAVEIFNGNFFRTRVSARLSVAGGHWDNPENCELEWVQVKFSHLNDWFSAPYTLEYEPDNYKVCKISFSPDELLSKLVFKGVMVELKTHCAHSIPNLASPDGKNWPYSYQLVLIPREPKDVSWYIELIASIRELFVFLIGSGVYTLDLSASQPSESAAKMAYLHYPVTVPRAIRVDANYFSTRFADYGGKIPEIIKNWFERESELRVPTATYRELLCSDGASPETILLRTVQTLEHLYGLLWPTDSKYAKKATFRRFIQWMREGFPSSLEHVPSEEMTELEQHKETILSRIGGINDLSLRSKLEHLFNRIPQHSLMPILGNPSSSEEFLRKFIPRLEATRHYLTHYNPEQYELAFKPAEIEDAALLCWAVLTFWMGHSLGLDQIDSGEIALRAKMAMFLINSDVNL